MENQLSAIELRVLVSEFQQLSGARLEQVYDLQGGRVKAGKAIALQIGRSEGRRFLVCLAPFCVFVSTAKPAANEAPGGFCSFLRHHLGGAMLLSISQLGSERILEMVFSSGLKLIIELFSKGNVIVVGNNGVILGCAEHQTWKDRTVRPGFAYQLPPATPDFAALSLEQFSLLVLSSEKDSVVKALAVDVGLSGGYAEELCATAGIAKAGRPMQLSQAGMERVYLSLRELLSRKPAPVAVLGGDGNTVEAFPFPVAASAAARVRQFDSFNDAVMAVAVRQLEAVSVSSQESSFGRKIREFEIAIEQQKAMIQGMVNAVDENTRAAELIYEHYLDVKQALDDYNRLRKIFTPEQLRDYFKGNKKVVSIDEKTGAVVVELA